MNRKTIANDLEYLIQISKEISFDDIDLKNDIKKLSDFCKEYECMAMAAIQIGIPKRLIYIKNTDLNNLYDKNHNEEIIMINPRIIFKAGKTKYWEACASCLDNMGLVERPYKITVEYYDVSGNRCKEDIEGFKTTVICHEIDHLDGILHMDIAKKVLQMNKDERKKYRETHPYEIISKDVL